jgi:glycosyltransferase involved in cell wall biosynthesis
MKIGLFTPNYPGVTGDGGIGTYTRNLAHALCKLGHELHVVTPGPCRQHVADGPVTFHLIRGGHIRILDRLLPGSGNCYRIRCEMRQIVRQHQLDVVEFPNWEGFGSFFCLRRPVPVVVRLHTSSQESQEIDGTQTSRLVRWDVRRERWIVRLADSLVTHSEAHRRRMASELRIDAGRIHVIHHGVPVYPSFSRPTRQQNGLTVVHLGRMEKRKGVLDLLRAIPPVLGEVPQTRFWFIGSDRPHCPGGRTHAEFIRDEFPAAVQQRISLLGNLPDDEVDRILQEADLLVAPSLYESFGLVFPEAMRWGLPVIGSTAGAIPEIVEDSKTGLLVPPASPGKLAQAIIALLVDPERRHTLGEQGRRHVERHFSIERMARDVETFYDRTVQNWRERAPA